MQRLRLAKPTNEEAAQVARMRADDAIVIDQSLPALIQNSANRLATARTAGELLDVIYLSQVESDAGRAALRFAKSKDACDEILGACLRVVADAIEIEYAAKARLANEYDAAQERGEIQKPGGDRTSIVLDENNAPATVADLGLTRKAVHEARQIRDAEDAEPGVVKRAIAEKVDAGEEPTKAAIRKAIVEAAARGLKDGSPSKPKKDKKPAKVENPSLSAVSALTGRCRDIVDLTKANDAAFILSGLLDDAMRLACLAEIVAARNALNAILETADAE